MDKEKRFQQIYDYEKRVYKRVPLNLSIKEYESLKELCSRIGESVNGFIKQAIRERQARIQKEQDKLDGLEITIKEDL